MPTFTLRPADAGYWQGQHSVIGASTVWEAVDEDPHDSDASYFRMQALAALPSHAGRVSTRIVQMGLARVRPISVSFTFTARVRLAGPPGGNAQLKVGFSDAQQTTYTGVALAINDAGYTQYSQTHTSSLLTGAAWRMGELAGLELYMETAAFPIPTQDCRVTQWEIVVDYDDPRTNWVTI